MSSPRRLWMIPLLLLAAPAFAEILVDEDFEDAALASRGWYDIWRWEVEFFIDPSQSVSGNSALEIRYEDGSTGPSMRHQFAGQDVIYTRYYRKWEPGWIWPTGGAGPHDTYLFGMYGDEYFPPTSTYITLYTDSRYHGQPGQPSSFGLQTRRDLQGESYLGYNAIDPPPPQFELNRWYCIETLATMNTPGSSNGTVQGWLDGELIFDVSGLELRDSDNDGLQFDQFMIGPYHHGGVLQVQSSWLDALVIANERVGCLGTEPPGEEPPAPPNDLQVD